PLSEDQLGMIDTLEYEDTDEGMIDHERLYRNREALVQELYKSERAYLESLELIQTIFLEPLREESKRSHFSFLGSKKTACTTRELGWLFGNFEEILKVQREILTSLEQSVAMTTYQRLTHYQPFKKFIESAHKAPVLKGTTLLALLQIPAGSIGRYAHLVSKLADVTSPMHPDHIGLCECKQRALRFFEEMKPRIMEADNVDQVLMIQQAMTGAPFGVSAKRRLILQGPLSRVMNNFRSPEEEQTCFLFSDMLVFVRPKQEKGKTLLQYKDHINLEQARIRAPDACETKGKEHCVEIISSIQGVDTLNTTYMGTRQVYMLHTSSAEDQQRWVKKLQEVVA
ncbi:Dbl homology domain-containing protein, partial [Dichotomocladium elegans]